MAKVIKVISIDVDLLPIINAKKINLSGVVNKYLHEYFAVDFAEDEELSLSQLDNELTKIEARKLKVLQEKKLEEFKIQQRLEAKKQQQEQFKKEERQCHSCGIGIVGQKTQKILIDDRERELHLDCFFNNHSKYKDKVIEK